MKINLDSSLFGRHTFSLVAVALTAWLMAPVVAIAGNVIHSDDHSFKDRTSAWSGDDEDRPNAKRRRKAVEATKSDDDDDETPATKPSRQSAAKADSDDHDEPVRKAPRKRVRVASLGDSGTYTAPPPKVAAGNVTWRAASGCLPGSLKAVISQVASYGAVTVFSTARGHSHNRRVGGARSSYHLSCQAADFRIRSNWGAASAFLRSHGSVGGFKHYGGGRFHIDTGPRRSW
jgi:hypothetical protein